MTADSERRALLVFEAMLRQPENTRDAWLEREVGDDDALLSRVRAMRDADRIAALGTGAALDHAEEETPPERIGAYRIVERIGSGGMGSVYRGERETGDFSHVVAIKVIKPGLLSESLIERFQRERSILARLRHPGIAQLYDGGETEGGSPFIVMEFVEGRPLLHWADEESPSPAARRRVFAAMCAAVAFAHRNLIVHRDLTPSNVLVTDDANSGWGVKLIDFGIARPADVLTDRGIAAERASIVSLSLTPGYAAPERMTGTTVTTAADVYSLGRLLEKLMAPAAGDRELRAVVARATAIDPQNRYATVEALADDVAAIADGRPVAAVGGGRGYRLGKFLARYQFQAAAAGIVLAALVTALILTTAAYRRAELARKAEAARFAELRSLATYLLFDLNDRLERTVGNTAARADLAREAQGYLSSLARSPHADPSIRYEAAIGLIKLARIQGVPSEPNLGDRRNARANLETAAKLLTQLRGEPAIAADAPLAEAQALQSVIYIHGDGDPVRAAAFLAQAQASLKRAVPGSAGWVQARRTLRKAELEHADLGDRAAAIPALADALEADIARWPAAMRQSCAARVDRAYATYYRALATMIAGDMKGSVPMFLEAERRFAALLRERPNDPAILYMAAYNDSIGFGAASHDGQEDISGRMIRDAKTSIDQLMRLEADDDAVQTLAANIKEGLSQNLRDNDRFAEAVAMQREVVEGRRKSARRAGGGHATGNLGFSLAIMGVIAKNAGDRALACSSWQESEAVFSGLDRNKQLVGFFAGFLPGLRENLRLCEAGKPASQFKPLKS